MTYTLLQDSRGATCLSARAQAVISAQARVADAAIEMREASAAYDAALSVYDQEKRRIAREPAERCSMCRDGVSHSARCHHDEHEVCDRVAEGTDAPKSCACPCHSPADPVR